MRQSGSQAYHCHDPEGDWIAEQEEAAEHAEAELEGRTVEAHQEAKHRDTVAALFVDPAGVYANLPKVELWDETRDARLYDGPWPVVAHPPCNRWVSYGAQAKRGDDGGCFAAAFLAVRTWGGVLEHPARSQAWHAFRMPHPNGPHWTRSLDDPGWVCEIDQHLYGFSTRKLTWLYYVGDSPPAMPWRHKDAGRGCETLWSTERSKTPPAFRDLLLELARSARMAAAA